jgi:hypothetical protein
LNPILLAGLQRLIPDPVIALQVFTMGTLVAVAASFYAVGSVLLRNRVGGLLTVVGAFLITDRFLELLAFGGLFQLAAVAFINVAIAAFVRAGDGGRLTERWWALGSVAIVLLALTHVGTATVGIPITLAVAGISVLRLRRLGWVGLLKAGAPLLIALVALGIYAAAVLGPASKDYVSNPASLFYRGPARLLSSLAAYGPTAAVVVLGGVAVVAGAVVDGLKRSFGAGSILLSWTAGAWGFLAVAAVAGTGTDYPRFAPIVLAPLVVAAAAGMLVAIASITRLAQKLVPSRRVGVVAVVLPGLLAVVAMPFAALRYQAQMRGYQPSDAAALTAADEYVNAALGSAPGAVLTSVRDGKWLEGLTGREALFDLPVRYAVRPDEWQRSVDAQTILRTSGALTNEFYFVKLSDLASNGTGAAPAATTIAMNHGGEFVDVLQLRRSDTKLIGASRTWPALTGPVEAEQSIGPSSATYVTRWEQSHGARSAAFSRTVTVLAGGSTMSIVDNAPGYRIQSLLRPAYGVTFTSVGLDGREARLCLPRVGEQEPCIDLWASEPDAQLRSTPDGIVAETTTSTQLSLYLTDITAGGSSVSLGVIDPAAVAARHDLKAAILLASDPVFLSRRARLEALGFGIVSQIGPYAVFQRP